MFSGGIVTGPALVAIFILAIAILLLLIIKFQVNAFVALLLTGYITGVVANMPLGDIAQTVTDGFGSTLGGIGMVTGLGVMLGKFMYEAGGIESIANKVLKAFGDKKSPIAVAISGFITGIPVFGDVVYIMFAPMLKVLCKKTKISMVTFACAISVATTCTFALVLPTAPPLAVAEELGIEIGIFFFYALVSAFVGMIVGGIVYGGFINKQDQKNKHFYTFDDLDEEAASMGDTTGKERMGALKALSILLVPIILILLGSFVPLAAGKEIPFVSFIGNKNFAMLVGVLYAALVSRKYRRNTFRIQYSDSGTVLRNLSDYSLCTGFYNCSPYNNSSHYGWYNCYIRSISDSVCDCYLCRWYWSFHAKRFRILGNQPFLRNLRTGYNQRMEYRWFRSRCCNSDFCINPFSLPGILTRIDVS